MRQLVLLPFHFRIALVTGVGLLVWTLFSTYVDFATSGVAYDLANKDFANYWTAGRLALSGQTADLFGPQPDYFLHLTASFGPDYPWHNWSYPPHILLLVMPLGLFGYKTAMALFLVSSCAFYLWAVFRFDSSSKMMLFAAIVPFVVHNLWAAQNGYFFAGCALGALALRDTRPVLAGVFLGILTMKPQLGILFPLLLIAERRWLVIVSAMTTTLALLFASVALFGLEAWRGYFVEVIPYQAHVMRDFHGPFLWMMPSVYGAMRSLGVTADVALTLHLVQAVPVAIVTIVAFVLARSDMDRSILLAVATFIITPYALSYDLGLFVPALARLGETLQHDEKSKGVFLTAAIMLPLLLIPLGALHLSLAPVVVFAIWLYALRASAAYQRLKAIFRLSPAST